jgi:oxygen-independent coproporphyrinogen-3 oxidase
MLALRLKEGFSLSEYKELFGEDFLIGREELLASFQSAGYIILNNDRISLTEKGFYVSNSIIVELL